MVCAYVQHRSNQSCLFSFRWIYHNKKLKIKLKIPAKEKKNNELEDCINSIFNNTTNCKYDGEEVTENTDVEKFKSFMMIIIT